MSPTRCETCIYWSEWHNAKPGSPRFGDCRRHAPAVMAADHGHPITKWPSTAPTAFCGEYKPKQP